MIIEMIHVRVSEWSFTTLKRQGTCRLAKEPCSVQATWHAENLEAVPDVCFLESWFDERVKHQEVTCEELAMEAVTLCQIPCTVTLESHLHGPITATVTDTTVRPKAT